MTEEVGFQLLLSLSLIPSIIGVLSERARILTRYAPINLGYPPIGRRVKIPFTHASDKELNEISQKVSTNMQILVAIYGVLLAFVVSTNAALAFVSWSFSIWSGFILAILLRVGLYTEHLSRAVQVHSRGELEDITYAASSFSNVAIILLVPSVAFVPAFSLIASQGPINVVTTYGWTNQEASTIALLSIFLLTIVWFTVMHTGRYLKVGGTGDLYIYATTLLGTFGIGYLNSAPLERHYIAIFGYLNYTVPALAIAAINFAGFFGGVSLLIFAFVFIARIARLFHRSWLARRKPQADKVRTIQTLQAPNKS